MIWCSCEPNRELVQYQLNDYQRLISLQTCPLCILALCMRENSPVEMAQPFVAFCDQLREQNLELQMLMTVNGCSNPKTKKKLIHKAVKLCVPKNHIYTFFSFHPVSQINKFSTSRYMASLQRSHTPAQFLRRADSAGSSAVISNSS